LENLLEEEISPDDFGSTLTDRFTVVTKHIDSKHFKGIDLPKIGMKMPGAVEDRSTILAVLLDTEDCCKQLLLATKEGLDGFKIEFKNATNKTYSTWNFLEAYIKGLDYESISSAPRAAPREVRCEIIYKHLDIDGVTL